MSTWITQSINFSKSKRDDNDDLFRYDMWFKMRAIPMRFSPNHQQVSAIYHSKFISRSLHILNASLSHIGKLSTLQHIINLITIWLTLTPTSFLKETCLGDRSPMDSYKELPLVWSLGVFLWLLLNKQLESKVIEKLWRARNIILKVLSPGVPQCNSVMMTSLNGNFFRVTGHLCGEFIGPRWIPHTNASDAELWCFLWSASE